MDAPEELTSLVPLIEEIRSRPVEGAAKTGSLALINLVPFAGGAVAAVIPPHWNSGCWPSFTIELIHI